MYDKVFTNGCFDLLHVGHFNLLMYCRNLAGPSGKVYVAIDADDKVTKDKGDDRPVFTQQERKEQLLSLKHDLVHLGGNSFLVNQVNFFNTNDELYRLIKSIRPDVVVKGEDWKRKKVVGDDIAEVKFFSYQSNNKGNPYSTTKIVDRVIQKIDKNYRQFKDEQMAELSRLGQELELRND
jgi:cytidyltransferase-like protein